MQTMSNNTAKRPEFYISEITCGDGTQISINANDIIVFVGPNNSGKSQALKDIYTLYLSINEPHRVVKELKKRKDFTLENYSTFINENSTKELIGNSQYYTGDGFAILISGITEHNIKNCDVEISKFFINFANTEQRLSIATPAPVIARNDKEKHPIHRLVKDDDYRKKISNYFFRAFGENIIPDVQNIKDIPLRLGADFSLNSSTAFAGIKEINDTISSYPMLHHQGDGMRSFAGIILNLIAKQYNTFLIDEPETFLHPPQATTMGQVISELASERQVFISTHSQHIIKGLLDKNPQRVKIIRITRPEKDKNNFSILDNEKISDFWKDPLLKHSDIMDGMFYKNVVICESDADCRFYSMINSFLKEQQQKFSETLFVHCGGKGRMKKVVQALRSLNIEFRVVPDIDLLNNKQTLIDLVEACGRTWEKDVDYNTLVDGLDKVKNSTGNEILEQIKNELGANVTQPLSRTKIENLQKLLVVKTNWDQIKKFGIAGAPQGQATQALQNLVNWLKEFNIHLVPCGELECFIKTVGGHGPDWLNNVLEKYSDIGADEYSTAREFVASWNL